MILPVYTNETKRLSDLIKERLSSGGPRVLCDVYEADYRSIDPVKICERFTHFIESINRVRRLNPSARKLLRQFNGIGSPGLNVALEPGLVFHFPAERPPYCFAPQTPTTVCPNFAADFPSRSIASVADRRPGKQNITTTTTTSSTTKSHFSVTGADLVSLSSSSSSSSMIRSSLFQRRSISCMLGSRQRGLPDRDHHSQKRSSMVTVTDTRAVAFNKITPSETWTAATLRSQRPTRSNIPLDKTEQSLRSREQSGSGIYATQSMITTGGLGCASISSGLNVTAISTASTNSLAINTSSGSKPSAVSSTLLVTATPTGTPTVPHPRHLGSGVFPSPVQNVESQITNHKPVEEIAVTTGPSSTMFSEANLQVSGPSAPTISTMVTGITNTTPQTLVTSNLISSNAPNYQIASLMLDPDTGLPFIATASTAVFPERTFFAFDAVMWTMRTLSDVDSVNQAVEYLQTLVDTGWICHTSGNTSHPFIFGSYFYTLLAPDLKAHGPQGSHVASEEVLCSGGGATDGSEWTASSSSTVSGSSNVQAGGSASFLSCTCD
ncbi:DEP domain-containing protein 5 [Fasciolopsis buskii]|uniref:DEP domain-containing protein 5 n=1 Tax=Fasciolopsis buskii TaxID=27845 RepID=A0A8E0RLB7_9TREM|nr:DEP domain-containing protein 5 [Fasciolopsis buski]